MTLYEVSLVTVGYSEIVEADDSDSARREAMGSPGFRSEHAKALNIGLYAVPVRELEDWEIEEVT